MNVEGLLEKKRELDGFRPLDPSFVKNLEDWFRVELTYTSNAIEGNTLTRQETAMVVEKGLTVGGKSLVEHLEATNHAKALDWVKAFAGNKGENITEKEIIKIHDLILKGIDDDNAGKYRSVPVRISGSRVILPNYVKVPILMEEFCKWVGNSGLDPINLAAEAHYRLVTIHPFVDGNGRTARLLMNLILIKNGFPPALIRKRDRMSYITSLEKAQLGGSKEDYYQIIYEAIERSFDIYLNSLKGTEEVE
ncbi:MAG: Fic family protein [Verrucomicrobia bacterium]|nr:MAG: Fic family protein [Verrucomicrobiota bacterium]